MRIVIGGMSHESNTLNPIITGPEDFLILHGPEMLEKWLFPYYSSTGIIETLKAAGCELIPTVLGRAVPNGVISAKLYAEFKAEFIERIKNAMSEGPIDGACLALHGSMKVEGLGCAEGDILAAFRKLLPDVPVTIPLDMHATVTKEMMAYADGFVGYKTAPHIDCRETGVHAARMLLETLKSGRKLTSVYVHVPVLIAGEKSESATDPMKSLIDKCRAAEKDKDVAAASYLLGFPWADNQNECVTALVTTYDNPQKAKDIALRLAEQFWEKREAFIFRSENYDSATSIQKACEDVLVKHEHPVFVSDSGDNPTAGSTGDSTDMLEKVLAIMDTVDRLPTPLLYTGFYAEKATKDCLAAGKGADIDIKIGGFWDKINGRPIPLKVRVLKTLSGYGPYKSDLAFVQYRNMKIVLTSKHIGFGDEELLPALGEDAKSYCLVVVKLGYLEACFQDIAARAILATTKGCSNEVLESIPFKKLTRPIYPLDKKFDYAPLAQYGRNC